MSTPHSTPPLPHRQTNPTSQWQRESKIAWSSIAQSEINLEKLRLLCHSPRELKREGYVLEPLSVSNIEKKLRCLKCGARASRRQGPRPLSNRTSVPAENKIEGITRAGGKGREREESASHEDEQVQVQEGEEGESQQEEESLLLDYVTVHEQYPILTDSKTMDRSHKKDTGSQHQDTSIKTHPHIHREAGAFHKGLSGTTETECSQDNVCFDEATSQTTDILPGGVELTDTSPSTSTSTSTATATASSRKPRAQSQQQHQNGDQKQQAPPPVCTYHTGRVSYKTFTCCGKHVSQPGCTTETRHTLPLPDDEFVREYWLYHLTPGSVSASIPAPLSTATTVPQGTYEQISTPQQNRKQKLQPDQNQTEIQQISHHPNRPDQTTTPKPTPLFHHPNPFPVSTSKSGIRSEFQYSTGPRPHLDQTTYSASLAPSQPYTASPFRPQPQSQTFVTTQSHSGTHHNQYLPAIALDCEMGTSTTNETELIRLTAIDFFTGRVLIDNLVEPSVAMKHYNTRYSGVTAQDMWTAARKRTCIFGRDAAREMVWRYVGPETIVVAHGGQHDLTALRWIHPLVVDTCILQSYMGVKTDGGRSLQNLCKVVLGIHVQLTPEERERQQTQQAQQAQQELRDQQGLQEQEGPGQGREHVPSQVQGQIQGQIQGQAHGQRQGRGRGQGPRNGRAERTDNAKGNRNGNGNGNSNEKQNQHGTGNGYTQGQRKAKTGMGRRQETRNERNTNTNPLTRPGHDSYEDAMACRELVIWWTNIIPDI